MKAYEVIWMLCLATLLAACGSGKTGVTSTSDTSGTSQNTSAQTSTPQPVSLQKVTGVAAAGAPINGQVTLKDAKGTLAGPVSTDSSGNFSLDVTGFVPPFILKVEGKAGSQPYVLYSATSQNSTVHINTITNLILAVASGMEPAQAFGPQGEKPGAAAITNAALQTAQVKAKELLQPLLDKYDVTIFEPLYGSYSADPGNRLDTLLDVIMVKVESGVLTISNKLNGAIITTGSLATLADISLDTTKAAEQTVLSDIQGITGLLAEFQAVISKGASLTSQDVEDFYLPDPYYGTSNGLTRAQDIAGVMTNFGPGAMNKNGKVVSVRNVRLVSDISADYSSGRGVSKVYVLNYDFIHENDVIVTGNNVTIGKETAGKKWKYVGDPSQGTAVGGDYGVTDNYGLIITMGTITITPDMVVTPWPDKVR